MPDFVLPDRERVLTWDDGEFAGVQVRVVRRMSVSDALRWTALDLEQDEEQQANAFVAKMRTVWQHIVAWNLVQRVKDADGNDVLDEEGKPQTEPIPITLENVLALPWELAIGLRDRFNAMYAEVATVPDPLSTELPNGSQSQAQQGTTGQSSPSRRNSTKRNRKTG